MSVSVKINIRDMFWVSVLALGVYILGMMVQFLIQNPVPKGTEHEKMAVYPYYIPLRLLILGIIITTIAIRFITIVDSHRNQDRESIIGLSSLFGVLACWLVAGFYRLLRLDDFLGIDRMIVWQVGGAIGFVLAFVLVEMLFISIVRDG